MRWLPIVPVVVFLLGAAPPSLDEADRERTKQLIAASGQGRLGLMMDWLKQGANVNDPDADGRTALHEAAAKGQERAVVMLLALGADLAAQDKQGRNPLMEAVLAKQTKLVELMADPEAAVNQGATHIWGVPPRVESWAEARKTLADNLRARLALAADQVDATGRTAWMHGVVNGVTTDRDWHWNGRQSRSWKQRDKDGVNVFMLAALVGRVDVLNSGRIEGTLADLRTTNKEGKTTLALAGAAGHADCVKAIWKLTAELAATEGDLPTVKSALQAQPAVHARDELVSRAVRQGHVTIVRHFMQEVKDRPLKEKYALFGVGELIRSAAEAGRLELVQALTDRSWWQDDRELLIRIVTQCARPDSFEARRRWLEDIARHPKIVAYLDDLERKLAEKVNPPQN
jgi:ankyrin repeat protein